MALNIEFLEQKEKELPFHFQLFGICLCCGKKFGLKLVKLDEKSTLFQFGCFIETENPKCIFNKEGVNCCANKACKIDTSIKQLQKEQMDYIYNLIYSALKEGKNILFDVDFNYEVSKLVYAKVSTLNQEKRALARITMIHEDKKGFVLQMWNYHANPMEESSFLLFPILPPYHY